MPLVPWAAAPTSARETHFLALARRPRQRHRRQQQQLLRPRRRRHQVGPFACRPSLSEILARDAHCHNFIFGAFSKSFHSSYKSSVRNKFTVIIFFPYSDWFVTGASCCSSFKHLTGLASFYRCSWIFSWNDRLHQCQRQSKVIRMHLSQSSDCGWVS